jgi:protein-S-isoprenylcysteine O-methyltransferase Ste14
MPQPQSQFDAHEAKVSAGHVHSKINLAIRLVIGFSVGLIGAVAILFVPAGTVHFRAGWVYLAILFVPTFAAYLYYYKHDPQLLERRLQNKEEVREQKRLIQWSTPLFIAAFLLPGFDYRWGWSRGWLGAEPLWLTLLSQAMVLVGILVAVWVFNVNRFAARTVRVEAGQKVISTGPYRFVRHPLYAGSAILWIFTPLALCSYITLPAFLLLVPFYVFRLLGEEKVLRAQLPGYSEYCLRTRFRLIPLVW